VAVLENAQWVHALGRYPKKQVLDDPVDVKMLRERVEAMRKATREPSTAQKKKLDVPWDELKDERDDTPDALWKAAKKIAPKILAGLLPLVRDSPDAAFLIAPEAKKTPAPRKRPTARRPGK
jgi:hypothetical protein